MGEFTASEKWELRDGEAAIPYSCTTTGDSQLGGQLLYQLKMSIRKANSIDVIVSFLMTTGVKLVIEELAAAVERGASLRILTGTYLSITQPEALYLLKSKLGDSFELRMYNDKFRAFHPKSYFFRFDNCSTMFVGSSNLSRSALTSGIEWNYCIHDKVDPDSIRRFQETFENLWQHHSIALDDEALTAYSKSWHRPAIYKDMGRLGDEAAPDTQVRGIFEPRGAQIEALYALERLRADGAEKGLIQAATGIGKTFLAAFDARGFNRVLFIAHREEILMQAARSFRAIHPDKTFGFFMNKAKETAQEFIFASVATLGQKEYLTPEYFAPDYFDYIVVDEFHHAVNDQYKRIIEYFRPRFMLGLTATPERLDGRDIYALCDYNVPYEISLAEGINKGLLVPFRYYGIFDDTDYSQLERNQGKYRISALNRAYIANAARNRLILEHYRKHRRRQALGFCCSREHAEAMAKYFTENNIPAAAVYSGEPGQYAMDRKAAIEALIQGRLEVIFSVDMFNEGVDIKSLDMVMLLRPTESPVIFLQQLGRGLRISHGKEYLVVLDFIGNYLKSERVKSLLAAKKQPQAGYHVGGASQYPDDCMVDFDIRLIDMWQRMSENARKKSDQIAAIIQEEFQRIAGLLGGRHPTRLELFEYMDSDVYNLCLKNSKLNPFKNYLAYLKQQNFLTTEEKAINDTYAADFLAWIENTNMVKVYKMPVLEAFLKNADGTKAPTIKPYISREETLASWKSFFAKNRNWRDLPGLGSYQEYLEKTDKWHNGKIEKMPVKHLIEPGIGFIKQQAPTDDILMELEDAVKEHLALPGLYQQMEDILQYRVQHYYWSRYTAEK